MSKRERIVISAALVGIAAVLSPTAWWFFRSPVAPTRRLPGGWTLSLMGVTVGRQHHFHPDERSPYVRVLSALGWVDNGWVPKTDWYSDWVSPSDGAVVWLRARHSDGRDAHLHLTESLPRLTGGGRTYHPTVLRWSADSPAEERCAVFFPAYPRHSGVWTLRVASGHEAGATFQIANPSSPGDAH